MKNPNEDTQDTVLSAWRISYDSAVRADHDLAGMWPMYRDLRYSGDSHSVAVETLRGELLVARFYR